MRSLGVGCGDEGPQVQWRRGYGARVRVVGSGRDVHDAPFGFGDLLHEQEAGRGGRGGLVAADWCVGSAVFDLFSFETQSRYVSHSCASKKKKYCTVVGPVTP